ncbi:protein SCO1/2 [Thermolongibacillus altinsuensis]|uniref:Protein SCO1/2 n=1 Tax=Thermolongibacillus altinsuensis TaxID=575256 RepID=A0A4R1QGJ9_9BACL|nr:SCO family protein [Thermolongibacillus altinsuensis]TCL51092.1 protein SCO1/2 [Thermolongibacillus altinsuensis]
MKKLYITFFSLLAICIGVGIFYFTVYRQAKMEFPSDVTMETAWGKPYSFSEMEPKVRLLEFVYTNCPDICPNTTFQMKQLKERLEKDGLFGKKVEFLTITIDPKRDTSEVMQAYAKMFEVESDEEGWIFLRGNEDDTKKVADAFNFQYRDPGNGMLIHTTLTYFLDENNRVIDTFGMGEKGFDKEKVYKAILEEVKE